MPANNELTLDIIADTKKAQADILALQKKIDKLGKSSGGSAKGFKEQETAIKGTSKSTKTLAKDIDKLGKSSKGSAKDLKSQNDSLKKVDKSSKKLSNNFDKLGKSSNGSVKGIKAQNKSLQSVSKSSKNLTRNLGALFLAYGGFKAFSAGAGSVIKFEQSMKKLEAVSKSTENEMKRLSSTAQELGASTEFSANQVGDGMNYMAMAGLSSSQILTSVGDVLDLATAGMVSLGDASDISTNIMSGFGMEADSVGKIADVMTATFTNSNTSVQQLGEAFKYVAPVASALNVSLEETATAIGVMGNAGLQGSIAGTTLQTTLLRLASQTPQAKKAMDDLGVSVFDSTGEFIGIENAMQEFNKATANMGTQEKLDKLKKIFGAEALKGVIPLMDSAGDGYTKLFDKIANSGGVAEKTAEKMRSSMQGAIDSMMSALEGLAIAIGNDLLPAMKDIVTGITDVVRSSKDYYNQNKATITTVVETATELGALILVLKGYQAILKSSAVASVVYQTAVVASATGMSIFNAAITVTIARMKLLTLALLKNPFTIFIAGAGTLLAVFQQISNEEEVFVERTRSLISVMEDSNSVATASGELWKKHKNNIGITAKEYNTFNVAIDKSIKALEAQVKVMKADDAEKYAYNITTAENAIHMLQKRAEMFGKITVMTEQKEQAMEYNKELENNKKNIEYQISLLEKQQGTVVKGTPAWTALQVEIDKLHKVYKKIEGTKPFEGTAKEGREVAKVTSDLNKLLKEGAEALDSVGPDIIKYFGELRKNTLKRIDSEKTALSTMLNNEKKLKNDIKSLSNETLAIHQNYANKRKALIDETQNKIYDVQTSGLNDYQKYLSDQKEADSRYAKAQDELKKGNLEKAQQYLDEYTALKEANAGAEIVIDEKVKVSKDTAQKELVAGLKKREELTLKIIKEEEKAEVIAHNAKIDMKVIELKALKAQITAQQELLKILGKIVETSTGVEFNFQADTAKETLEDLDKMIYDISQQKIDIKIKADSEKIDVASRKIETLSTDVDVLTAKTKESIPLVVDTKKTEENLTHTMESLGIVATKLSKEQFLTIKTKRDEYDNLKEDIKVFYTDNREKILNINDSEAKTKYYAMIEQAHTLESEIDKILSIKVSTENADKNIDTTKIKVNELSAVSNTKSEIKIDTTASSENVDKTKAKVSELVVEASKENEIKISSETSEQKIDNVGSKLNIIRTKLSEEQYLTIRTKQEEYNALRDELNIFLNDNKEKIISVNDSDAKTKFFEMKAKAEELSIEIETIKELGITTESAVTKATTATDTISNLNPEIVISTNSGSIDTAKRDAESINTINPNVIVSTEDSQIQDTKYAIDEIDSSSPTVVVEADNKSLDGTGRQIDAIDAEKPKVEVLSDGSAIAKVADEIVSLSYIEPLVTVSISDNKDVIYKRIMALNGINTRSDHTIYYHYVGKHQTGGLIQQLPRFANGGHLDNGRGHTRKQGKLSGFGGGDKIKALLEAGEFIVKKEAVQRLGVGRLKTINEGKIPRFKEGGYITPRFADGGSVASSSIMSSLTLGGIPDLPDTASTHKINVDSSSVDEYALKRAEIEEKLAIKIKEINVQLSADLKGLDDNRLSQLESTQDKMYNLRTSANLSEVDAEKVKVEELARLNQLFNEQMSNGRISEAQRTAGAIDSINYKTAQDEISQLKLTGDAKTKAVNDIIAKYSEESGAVQKLNDKLMDTKAIDFRKNASINSAKAQQIAFENLAKTIADSIAKAISSINKQVSSTSNALQSLKGEIRGVIKSTGNSSFGARRRRKARVGTQSSSFFSGGMGFTYSTGGLAGKKAEPKRFSTGGSLSGYGGGDRINALLEAGEFVIRKEAVRKLGINTMKNINQGNLAKFSTGGSVGNRGSSMSVGRTVNLNLNIGDKQYNAIADEDVANALERHLRRNS